MDKKKIISLIVLVIGIIALVTGVIFLVLKLTKGPAIQDGEYLVSAENWVLENNTNCEEAAENAETNCLPGVIWDFTEIGKGTLTTNNHTNDYDFVWTIKDDKLIIRTNWLYELENEYDYELNQNDGILTLKAGEEEYIFSANFEN